MMPDTAPCSFDALIIGAGPAGCTVAIHLARAGWSVALVEKQRFPRRKVCGECIAASNLPLLEALGLGDAFAALAGPDLHQVRLLRGDKAVVAALPAAEHQRFPWGRALGREALDSLLLAQARAAGALVFQPAAVQAMLGGPGAWHCEVRILASSTTATTMLRLRAKLLVDAHGSWEPLPSDRRQQRQSRSAADLFAFKANFAGSSLPPGQISVLALDGGYGGMVVADQGLMILACCIRRDRLSELRGAAPGLSASEAVEAWLQRECTGVREAVQGARRDGPWLASGPLDPGVRVGAADGIFRVGNAAGEAHPILGEGISMALQSAALLGSHLLGELGEGGTSAAPDAAAQADLQRAYAADWRRQFAPRLRLAAAFAQLAMRPRPAAALMALVQTWPALLTQGARWGGKVRAPELAAPGNASLTQLREEST